MLRTNLSTRPFYNVRAVRALLGLFAFIVIGVHAVQRRGSSSACRRGSARSVPTPCEPRPKRHACARRPPASGRGIDRASSPR
jgi:hypothetical protein